MKTKNLFTASLVLLAAGFLPSQAIAATMLLDFGNNPATPTDAVQSDGNFWNYFSGNAAGPTALQTTTGAASGLTADPEAFNSQSTNTFGGETAYIPSAASDYFYIDLLAANHTGIVTLTGLDTSGNTLYDFTFFASSNRNTPVTDWVATDYSIGGQTVSLAASGNQSNTATISGYIPTSPTEDIVVTHNVDATRFAGLGVLEINTTIVPEPSSTALLALGGLALVVRRRTR